MAKHERGSARITVDLSNGVITVTHGYDGSLLFEGMVAEGTWDALWDAIRLGELNYDTKETR